ncbi:MAG: CPBP family intramembrane metalloprotease [Anaerolineae bacterium]|nr:CPBP family intramembrane metalloprotease [Anaerolineae bacterium]
MLTWLIALGLTIIQKNVAAFKDIGVAAVSPVLAVICVSSVIAKARMPLNVAFDRIVLFRTVVGLALPLGLSALAGWLGAQAVGSQMTWPKVSNGSTGGVLATLGILLIGAIGEEVGWRGYLQPVLETRLSLVLASTMVGLAWGLWHFGYYTHGALFVIGFTLFTVASSIILGIVMQGTGHNLLIAVVFHVFVNVGFVLFFKETFSDGRVMLVNGGVWLAAALLTLGL